MTTPTPATPTGATSPAPAEAAIARLHPFDGLFLRAEHLNRIQEYTRELTRALGQAGGPGVVHGYHVRVQDAVLEVTPGLAIDPGGRPLLMTTSYNRILTDLNETTGVWVIELVGEEVPFGDEEVYGALCDDPRSGGMSTRPFIGERVAVRLRKDNRLSEIAGSKALKCRSAVASAWFERERKEIAALIPTSERDSQEAANFSFLSWNEPTGLAGGDAVPIGVLLKVGGQWDVDVWIARRDRIETPPRRAWQQRLGMRPLDVFVAQILQFQVHLASRWPQASAALVSLAHTHLAVSKLDEAAEELRRRRTKAALEYVTAASSALQGLPTEGTTLVDYGFLELPPAGYLPLTDRSALKELPAMLGQCVTLRFCACRADYVAHAVEEAQHLDRISLTRSNPKPRVDILVPDGDWSHGQLTTKHNWVAFHRCRERDCDGQEKGERVAVYRHDAESLDVYENTINELVKEGVPPQPSPNDSATVTFAADPTTAPAPGVQPFMAEWTAGAQRVTLVGLAKSKERLPLAAARAAALVSILNLPIPVESISSVVMPKHDTPEAIYIIVLRSITEGLNT